MRSRAGRAVIPVDRLPSYGHETDATRIPGDEVDILFPRTVLWRSTGSAEQAIDDVLALPVPVPDATHPPRRNGSWMPTGPGRWAWLTGAAPTGR
jgi:hypothetical protein